MCHVQLVQVQVVLRMVMYTYLYSIKTKRTGLYKTHTYP